MPYSGSCHCGAVTFDVAADAPGTAMRCNCSHCRRKGLLLSFVPANSFTVTAGEWALSDYLFNRRAITHRFCKTCGCQPFSRGTAPDGTETVAVNLRCVPAIDLDTLEIQNVDGASF